MSKRGIPFRAQDLRVVGHAPHLPLVIGDFVRLNSGSPVGLVRAMIGDEVEVSFLDGETTMRLAWVCFTPICGGMNG